MSVFVEFVYTRKYDVETGPPTFVQVLLARVFCAFSPTDMERNSEKQVKEMHVQFYNDEIFFSRISSDINFMTPFSESVLLKPNKLGYT